MRIQDWFANSIRYLKRVIRLQSKLLVDTIARVFVDLRAGIINTLPETYISTLKSEKVRPSTKRESGGVVEMSLKIPLPEREKQISYNIASMWNLEKWYR